MCVEMKVPPLLLPGSRVALVAPAGPLRNESDLQLACDNARAMGWEPVVGEHVLARVGYLAGDDDRRLADLNRLAADRSIDGIWCIRGGYGAMRLLDRIDYSSWFRRPKALIGYSDITALHCALSTRADLVSYHGPTARAHLTEFSRASLRAAVVDGTEPCGVANGATTLRCGRARGRLIVGNLALLTALCGTRYAPSYAGAILVVEDVNESVYRVDRMLTQLRLSGALRLVAGIAFGQFTEIPEDPENQTRSMNDVLAEFAQGGSVPCIANVPVGHVSDQWTVPFGAIAELDADGKTLFVRR